MRYDIDESAVDFDRHWLDRSLPTVDPAFRILVEAEVRAQQAAVLADFPATVRRLLRRQLTVGPSGSDDIAQLAAVTLAGLGRRDLSLAGKWSG